MDLLEGIADEVIFSVAQAPQQYLPERGNLATYLRLAARRDVLNALARERRRARWQIPLRDVELLQRAGNTSQEADPAELVSDRLADAASLIAQVHARFTSSEWAIVQLILDGERRTERFAALLGLADRPREEQAREVKRVKDRLLRRLRRLAPLVQRDD